MARRHRHCVVCGKPLPKRCSPQRKYCDGACKASAYRDRRKSGLIIGTAVHAWRLEERGKLLAAAPYHCALCWKLILPGVRRRADAQYCSGKCRTRAWRARESARAQLAAVTSSRHPDGPEAAL